MWQALSSHVAAGRAMFQVHVVSHLREIDGRERQRHQNAKPQHGSHRPAATVSKNVINEGIERVTTRKSAAVHRLHPNLRLVYGMMCIVVKPANQIADFSATVSEVAVRHAGPINCNNGHHAIRPLLSNIYWALGTLHPAVRTNFTLPAITAYNSYGSMRTLSLTIPQSPAPLNLLEPSRARTSHSDRHYAAYPFVCCQSGRTLILMTDALRSSKLVGAPACVAPKLHSCRRAGEPYFSDALLHCIIAERCLAVAEPCCSAPLCAWPRRTATAAAERCRVADESAALHQALLYTVAD
ncbi:hypothetical protein JKP88DRAFT_253461 [Tribonema minus]|uniref:Uncharacterized protein n=1 Tax=Tribonema minus TaxID=303371 RepID=A0A835Z9J7_9STRA|nr:hypothetical protein JKP88DRAFT_253461 [Tribonema minus]